MRRKNNQTKSRLATLSMLPHKTADNFDLSVFNDIGYHYCRLPGNHIENCQCFIRVFTCLQYYSLLNVKHDKDHRSTFQHFIENVYNIQNLLNDHHHLLKNHSGYLTEIKSYLTEEKSFKACDEVKQCQYSHRHHRSNTADTNHKKLDPILALYCSTLDGIHFYVFHLYHIGLRVHTNENITDDGTNHEEKHDEFFDAEFGQFRKSISMRRHTTSSYQRFPNVDKHRNSKFVININKNKKYSLNVDKHTNINNTNGITDLDTIFSYLERAKVDDGALNRLKTYIIDEEFCTEAVNYDINDIDGLNGNILKFVGNV